MIWIPLYVIYFLGYVFTFRRLAGQIAWHWKENGLSSYRAHGRPNGDQWGGAILLSLFASIVWPVSLPIAYGLQGAGKGVGMFYCPPNEKMRLQAERIRQLEVAAGVRESWELWER